MKHLAFVLLSLFSLAADAGVFATATAPNGRQVILYDDECPKSTPQTYKVDLTAPDGGRLFVGCWYSTGDMVEIRWEDNDTSTIPIRFFTLGAGKRQVPNS